MNGRKDIFKKLELDIAAKDRVIWFHCASLGEFEQGRPIIEQVKKNFPKHKILLTFFSPSGYEIQKNYPLANVITYLPLDTKKNARKFIELVHPEMAIFVKYEFWPNILNELNKKNVKTILVSAIFREDQAFFKFYGGWMKQSLEAFEHFFVQNETSQKLLQKIGFKNSTVSGDTRFDRVQEITQQNNQLNFIDLFLGNDPYVLVAGSTWKKDEELLVKYINSEENKEKVIIAPHNIHANNISELYESIQKGVCLYSENKIDPTAQVLIVDSIGFLTKIYGYGSVAYVGGGFGKDGVHNVLEPAAFGIPVVIGPNFDKFIEAVELTDLQACEVIIDQTTLDQTLKSLKFDSQERLHKGNLAKRYIEDHTGSTKIILEYLIQNLPD